jgi:hypothetical protein
MSALFELATMQPASMPANVGYYDEESSMEDMINCHQGGERDGLELDIDDDPLFVEELTQASNAQMRRKRKRIEAYTWLKDDNQTTLN